MKSYVVNEYFAMGLSRTRRSPLFNAYMDISSNEECYDLKFVFGCPESVYITNTYGFLNFTSRIY